MIIACDVDSTLYPAESLFATLSREAGIDYPENAYQWCTYKDIKKLDGSPVTQQELKSVFRKAHSAEYIHKQIPYENAAKILSSVRKKYDIDIYFVSDRHGQSAGPLKQWLVDNKFMDFTGDHVIATKDKRHWLRHYKPEILIDDRVRTILMARYELNAKVIGIRQNHNINLKNEADGIYIEDNWLDIGKTLGKLLDRYFD